MEGDAVIVAAAGAARGRLRFARRGCVPAAAASVCEGARRVQCAVRREGGGGLVAAHSSEKLWHALGACFGYSSTVKAPMLVSTRMSSMAARKRQPLRKAAKESMVFSSLLTRKKRYKGSIPNLRHLFLLSPLPKSTRRSDRREAHRCESLRGVPDARGRC